MTWEELLILLFGAGGVGAGALKMIQAWATRRQIHLHESELERIQDLYAALNRLIQIPSASRALLLRMRNGGNIVKIGSPVRVAVVHEVAAKGVARASAKWSERVPDRTYHEMLWNVLRDGHHKIITADLEDNSDLKLAYTADNVQSSEVFSIHFGPNEFIYLSLNLDSVEPLSATDAADLREVVGRLRAMFRNSRGPSRRFDDV